MSEFDSVAARNQPRTTSILWNRLGQMLTMGSGASGLAGGPSAGPIVGSLATLFLGIVAFDYARSNGRELGRFNAFITAFGDAIYCTSRDQSPAWNNHFYPNSVIKGRNAARQFLRSISQSRREQILRRYRAMGSMGSRRAIQNAFGGLRM